MADRPPVSISVAVLPSVCQPHVCTPYVCTSVFLQCPNLFVWACLSALQGMYIWCAACVYACWGAPPLPFWSAGQVWWLWFRSPQRG